MVITLSELQTKEIIDVENGQRLGQIHDLEIEEGSGRIQSLVLAGGDAGSGLFKKSTEILIDWKQIKTIGSDVILVYQTEQKLLPGDNDFKNDTI